MAPCRSAVHLQYLAVYYNLRPSAVHNRRNRMPDSSSGSDKKGLSRKMPTLGKRSAPMSPRVTTTDDGAVGESISRPWNVQASPLLLTLLPDLGLNFF